MTNTKKKLLIIAAVLVVTGGVLGAGLYLAYPVQMSTVAGLSRNFIITLGSPAGTLTAETNPSVPKSCADVFASDHGRITEHGECGLAELQPDGDVAALFAGKPDQHRERWSAEGLVQL